MIKKILFGFALLTAVASCTDDYTDWAQPQANPQQDAVTFGDGSVAPVGVIDFANIPETQEMVQVCTITAPSASVEGYAPQYLLNIGENEFTINANGEIKASELNSYIKNTFGRRPTEREADATISMWLNDGTSAVKLTSGTFKIKAIPDAPVISTAYYLVGDMFTVEGGVNGWSAAAMQKFSHSGKDVYDDPVFTIKFKTTKENQYWKIIPQENVDGEFWTDPGVVGTVVNGDAAMSGTLTREGAKAGVIETPGKYIMTINMIDYSYTIEPAPLELYMTGSKYNWGGTWVPMIPVNGSDEDFWTIAYFDADEQVKFAPQADWGNDFGGNVDVINDVAGAGAVNDNTNLKIANAGWYMLHIVNGTTRKVEILEPNVYLMGDAAGEWNINDTHKFTIPATADGTFESPAFAADSELRMCVSLDGFEWWKTEFMIFDGKIDFRGRGGDQARVNVAAGQKAYLNFKKGTGEIR